MSEWSCEEINRPTFREVHTPAIVFFLNVPFCISSFFRLTVLLTRRGIIRGQSAGRFFLVDECNRRWNWIEKRKWSAIIVWRTKQIRLLKARLLRRKNFRVLNRESMEFFGRCVNIEVFDTDSIIVFDTVVIETLAFCFNNFRTCNNSQSSL